MTVYPWTWLIEGIKARLAPRTHEHPSGTTWESRHGANDKVETKLSRAEDTALQNQHAWSKAQEQVETLLKEKRKLMDDLASSEMWRNYYETKYRELQKKRAEDVATAALMEALNRRKIKKKPVAKRKRAT